MATIPWGESEQPPGVMTGGGTIILPEGGLALQNPTPARQGDLPVAGMGDEFSLRVFGDKAFGDETVHQASDGKT